MDRQVAHVQINATLEDLTQVVAEKQQVEPWRIHFLKNGAIVDDANPLQLTDMCVGEGVEFRVCGNAAIVTSSNGGQLLLVNVDTREIWRRYNTHSVPVCIAVCPATTLTRTCVFCGCSDGSLHKFDLSLPVPLMNIRHPRAPTVLTIGVLSRVIFTGCEDGFVRKFSIRSGLCKLKLEPHAAGVGVFALTMSPCERYLYVSSGDFMIRKYDALGGGCRSTYGEPQSRIWKMFASFCGLFLYTVGKEVLVFDIESAELLSADDAFLEQRDVNATISACELSYAGDFLFLAVGTRLFKYETEGGTLIYSVEVLPCDILTLSGSESQVLATGTDGTLCLIDAATGAPSIILEENQLRDCAFIP